MKIYTKVEFEWNEYTQEYESIHEEWYDYDGPLDLAITLCGNALKQLWSDNNEDVGNVIIDATNSVNICGWQSIAFIPDLPGGIDDSEWVEEYEGDFDGECGWIECGGDSYSNIYSCCDDNIYVDVTDVGQYWECRQDDGYFIECDLTTGTGISAIKNIWCCPEVEGMPGQEVCSDTPFECLTPDPGCFDYYGCDYQNGETCVFDSDGLNGQCIYVGVCDCAVDEDCPPGLVCQTATCAPQNGGITDGVCVLEELLPTEDEDQVAGCMSSIACTYDETANLHIVEMCIWPDECGVCEGIAPNGQTGPGPQVFCDEGTYACTRNDCISINLTPATGWVTSNQSTTRPLSMRLPSRKNGINLANGNYLNDNWLRGGSSNFEFQHVEFYLTGLPEYPAEWTLQNPADRIIEFKDSDTWGECTDESQNCKTIITTQITYTSNRELGEPDATDTLFYKVKVYDATYTEEPPPQYYVAETAGRITIHIISEPSDLEINQWPLDIVTINSFESDTVTLTLYHPDNPFNDTCDGWKYVDDAWVCDNCDETNYCVGISDMDQSVYIDENSFNMALTNAHESFLDSSHTESEVTDMFITNIAINKLSNYELEIKSLDQYFYGVVDVYFDIIDPSPAAIDQYMCTGAFNDPCQTVACLDPDDSCCAGSSPTWCLDINTPEDMSCTSPYNSCSDISNLNVCGTAPDWGCSWDWHEGVPQSPTVHNQRIFVRINIDKDANNQIFDSMIEDEDFRLNAPQGEVQVQRASTAESIGAYISNYDFDFTAYESPLFWNLPEQPYEIEVVKCDGSDCDSPESTILPEFTAADPNWEITFEENGKYQFRLRVYDIFGNYTDLITKTVYVNNIVDIQQSVLGLYSPWQGINILGNFNRWDNIETIDVDDTESTWYIFNHTFCFLCVA